MTGLGPHYQWTDIGMIDYNPTTNLYLVKRISIPKDSLPLKQSSSGGPGSEGNSSSEESDNDGISTNDDNTQYWVPRIRLLFAAEDPIVFAERVSKAYELRQQTEASLRYHLYVDCMPVNKEVGCIQCESLNRMTTIARSTEILQQPR